MNKDMMARLGQMQNQLQKAQEDMENRVALGTAGGGVIQVEITGAYRVKSVKIEPEAVDADDTTMLEDLFSAAVNDALQKVQEFQSDLTGGLGLPGTAPEGPAPDQPSAPANRAARRANKR